MRKQERRGRATHSAHGYGVMHAYTDKLPAKLLRDACSLKLAQHQGRGIGQHGLDAPVLVIINPVL